MVALSKALDVRVALSPPRSLAFKGCNANVDNRCDSLLPMRRVFLLLLALILPLKAIGAVVVPITGTPHHHHQAQHQHEPATHAGSTQGDHQSPHHHVSAHASCEGMAQSVDAHEGTLHEHACPHLGMATLVSTVTPLEPPSVAPFVEDHAAIPFTSVVLDIVVPPPN